MRYWKQKNKKQKKCKLMIIGKSYFSHKLKWIHNSKTKVELIGRCFKQKKVTSSHRNLVNLSIAYELDT